VTGAGEVAADWWPMLHAVGSGTAFAERSLLRTVGAANLAAAYAASTVCHAGPQAPFGPTVLGVDAAVRAGCWSSAGLGR
jgi:hypothetical protein